MPDTRRDPSRSRLMQHNPAQGSSGLSVDEKDLAIYYLDLFLYFEFLIIVVRFRQVKHVIDSISSILQF